MYQLNTLIMNADSCSLRQCMTHWLCIFSIQDFMTQTAKIIKIQHCLILIIILHNSAVSNNIKYQMLTMYNCIKSFLIFWNPHTKADQREWNWRSVLRELVEPAAGKVVSLRWCLQKVRLSKTCFCMIMGYGKLKN